jgi:hypothetical protein
MANIPQHVLYAGTPVHLERTPSGGMRVLVFDTKRRGFFPDSTYLSRILYDRDNLAQTVNVETFQRRVAHLKFGTKLNPLQKVPTQKIQPLRFAKIIAK